MKKYLVFGLIVALLLGWLHVTPVFAIQSPGRQYRTFLDWCHNRDKLDSRAASTVGEVLKVMRENKARATNQSWEEIAELSCEETNTLLLRTTQLSLNGATYKGNTYNDIEDRTTLFITDLRPLQSLTHLTELDLSENLIADLRPRAIAHQFTYTQPVRQSNYRCAPASRIDSSSHAQFR